MQELKAKAAISEREGALDNKTKIELIKAEEKIIQEERAEQQTEEEQRKLKEAPKEEIIDTAPVLNADTGTVKMEKKDAAEPSSEEEITAKDIETLETALDTLGKEKKKMIVEKEELNELKEELQDYEEVSK